VFDMRAIGHQDRKARQSKRLNKESIE